MLSQENAWVLTLACGTIASLSKATTTWEIGYLVESVKGRTRAHPAKSKSDRTTEQRKQGILKN